MHSAILLFPKTDKHSLGQQLQAQSLQLIETICVAGRLNPGPKKERLVQAAGQLDLLKLLLRLAYQTKATNDKKYLLLQTHLQETGKMLGGWLRSLN